MVTERETLRQSAPHPFIVLSAMFNISRAQLVKSKRDCLKGKLIFHEFRLPYFITNICECRTKVRILKSAVQHHQYWRVPYNSTDIGKCRIAVRILANRQIGNQASETHVHMVKYVFLDLSNNVVQRVTEYPEELGSVPVQRKLALDSKSTSGGQNKKLLLKLIEVYESRGGALQSSAISNHPNHPPSARLTPPEPPKSRADLSCIGTQSTFSCNQSIQKFLLRKNKCFGSRAGFDEVRRTRNVSEGIKALSDKGNFFSVKQGRQKYATPRVEYETSLRFNTKFHNNRRSYGKGMFTSPGYKMRNSVSVLNDRLQRPSAKFHGVTCTIIELSVPYIEIKLHPQFQVYRSVFSRDIVRADRQKYNFSSLTSR
ncbi:hypothetical protein J6590_017877 [Homalodisca vitripennis]|nr:hypothetical protein J6590_017877 [Homalodisca vitripennis]